MAPPQSARQTTRHRYNTRSRSRHRVEKLPTGETLMQPTDAARRTGGTPPATSERRPRRVPYIPPPRSTCLQSGDDSEHASQDDRDEDGDPPTERRRLVDRHRYRYRRFRRHLRRMHPGRVTPPPNVPRFGLPPMGIARPRPLPPMPYPLCGLIDDIALAIHRHAPALTRAAHALPHHAHFEHRRTVHAPLRRTHIPSHDEWSSSYLAGELRGPSGHSVDSGDDHSDSESDDEDASEFPGARSDNNSGRDAWDIDEHNAYRVEYSPYSPPHTPEQLPPDADDDMPDADVDLDGVDVERQRAILAEIGRHATHINGIEVPPPPKAGETETDCGPLQCVACAVHKRATLLGNCGHVVLCVTCARRICHGSQRTCPVCREPITRVMRACIPG